MGLRKMWIQYRIPTGGEVQIAQYSRLGAALHAQILLQALIADHTGSFKLLAKTVIETKSFYTYAEDQIVNGTPYCYEHYYTTFGS